MSKVLSSSIIFAGLMLHGGATQGAVCTDWKTWVEVAETESEEIEKCEIQITRYTDTKSTDSRTVENLSPPPGCDDDAALVAANIANSGMLCLDVAPIFKMIENPTPADYRQASAVLPVALKSLIDCRRSGNPDCGEPTDISLYLDDLNKDGRKDVVVEVTMGALDFSGGISAGDLSRLAWLFFKNTAGSYDNAGSVPFSTKPFETGGRILSINQVQNGVIYANLMRFLEPPDTTEREIKLQFVNGDLKEVP